MSHVYCPECGFQNPEAANYCSRCGALLVKAEAGGETTMSYSPDAAEDEPGAALEDIGTEGPALVVRSGGGRAGEHFMPSGERTTIGRSPDCDIFLDDVTVSRRHAILVQRNGAFFIEDEGSLNGTFLNRRRIESTAELENGDELQIGKYRLSFISGRA
jgi:FHA domain/zinc-ribbon domain